MAYPPRALKVSFATLLVLFGVALLYVVLRRPWAGHLLMWDEAMNLCSVRALASGGYDWYSYWIWRYPPLFNVLLLLARPLETGYLARADWLPVLMGVATLPVLYALNDRVFGRRVALWSCLAWTLLPASVFFGVWIKQDVLVPFFGLLSLLLFMDRRIAWSGLALGLALLTKEIALFYALALAAMALGKRRYRDLAVVAFVAGLTAGWWFLFFSESVRFFTDYAVGRDALTEQAWHKPWRFYFDQLPGDVGGFALMFALVGLTALLHHFSRERRGDGSMVWPLVLLVPAYAILTWAKGKTPWYTVSLLPAWATLAAVGFDAILSRVTLRLVSAVLAAAFAVGLSMPLWGRDYERVMEKMEPGMWWASSASREAAETLNRVVKDGEQALITPMHYYDASFMVPCPIFVAYLKPMPVMVRANTLSAEQLVRDARALRLDWAMVSPPPGSGEETLLWPLMERYGLRPLWLQGACVFRMRDAWKEQPWERSEP